MKLSDLKLAVKCCTACSIEWEDTCGSCPLNKGAETIEEMADVGNCVNVLISALAEYLPEEEPYDSNNNQK